MTNNQDEFYDEDGWATETKAPNFFEGLIIVFTMIISKLFFSGKRKP